jgi:shikimate dehydrogenase
MEADFLRLGLLGWPLRSSRSPSLHNRFLEQAGLRGDYSLIPVEPGNIGTALSSLHARGFLGLNLTMPHKTSAMEHCAEVDGAARRVGAVNTLLRTSRGWMGYNTDPDGFGQALERYRLYPAFAVVGCGGAGRAVSSELARRGLEHRVFCNSIGLQGSLPLAALEDYARSGGCSTVVNATPLGWQEADIFPLDAEALRGKAFFDLNYNPRWAWRNGLPRLGVDVRTGELMLACQAAASFRIWTGVGPDPGRALAETDPGIVGSLQ